MGDVKPLLARGLGKAGSSSVGAAYQSTGPGSRPARELRAISSDKRPAYTGRDHV